MEKQEKSKWTEPNKCPICRGIVCDVNSKKQCQEEFPDGVCPGGYGPDSCLLSPFFICECG